MELEVSFAFVNKNRMTIKNTIYVWSLFSLQEIQMRLYQSRKVITG